MTSRFRYDAQTCRRGLPVLLAILTAAAPPPAHSQADQARLLGTVEYRNLGPFRTGAWVSDFAVPEHGREHLYTFYVAMRSGGVWKTTNNGTTFEPVFDGNGAQAIGDVTVAPSDNDIVWVGTGDNAAARSSRPGIGVFKSEDAGETWRHMGLGDSHHIARILVHPTDPDVVYVAAMGHLFSRNEERGLFRSTDGGATWEKVLYVNDGVGVVDVALDRDRPDLLFAATYEMARYPWHFEAGGPQSAIYRSADGGSTWERLTRGLPDGPIGRIGLDVWRGDGDTVYAIFENLNPRTPTAEEAEQDREAGREPRPRTVGGEVYRSDDSGRSWRKVSVGVDNLAVKAPYSFNQIFVDPNDSERVFVTSEAMAHTADGGKSWQDLDDNETLFRNNFGDVRSFWIDPRDSARMLFGSDGGVYVSYDGGVTSDHLYNLPTGEIYALGVDTLDPYNIYVGLQDHESWKGPVNSWSGAVTLEDWVLVGLWDGMYNEVDPVTNRYLYTTAQFGGHRRVDQHAGSRKDIEPPDSGDFEPRFPWTPAIRISPHDSNVVYAGAQRLLKSEDRGDTWLTISPDLTHATMAADGGRCADAGGAQGWINYCTITSVDESRLRQGLVWAGTDDGRVWVTEDGGARWREVTAALAAAGAPEDFWVSRVRASGHAPGTAWVTKSGMRFDRFAPHVYVTNDYGDTWTSLAANLPDSPVNVVFEDPADADVLYLGSERGVYVTLDGGTHWLDLSANMPDVAVTDLLVHPRERDLVVATYGRGAWIADVSIVPELRRAVDSDAAYLFDVEDNVVRRSERSSWGAYHMKGDRHLATPNEPAGFAIHYYLPRAAAGDVVVTVHDESGNEHARIAGERGPGVHRVHWDSAAVEGLEPGRFRVTLSAAGRRIERFATLEPPRAFPVGQVPGPTPATP